jgi:hypothetical protein
MARSVAVTNIVEEALKNNTVCVVSKDIETRDKLFRKVVVEFGVNKNAHNATYEVFSREKAIAVFGNLVLCFMTQEQADRAGDSRLVLEEIKKALNHTHYDF